MEFVDTCFTGRENLIVFCCSPTNNGLQKSNQFRFESEAVKVSCISKSMCSGFAPTFTVVKFYTDAHQGAE
jgi:hypothetical protein